MGASGWEFWIDVGGTFTDCLAKAPDGSIRRHKLLSSGAIKGRVGSGSARQTIVDAHRKRDPPGFWTGWRLLIAADDSELESALVTGFDAATRQLHVTGLSQAPIDNASYELRSDL